MKIGNASIPESLARLEKLTVLDLSDNGLRGTIPPSFTRLVNLNVLRLSTNELVGTIPAIPVLPREELPALDLHNNQLTGAIPNSIAQYWSTALLSHNNLTALTFDFFSDSSSRLNHLDISYNHVKSSLPDISNSTISIFYASSNQLFGTVPTSYQKLWKLNLDNNLLSGSVEDLFFSRSLTSIYINQNEFNGTIPSLGYTVLTELVVSNNKFTGPFPYLPTSLKRFDAGNNRFNTHNWNEWVSSLRFSKLQYVDIQLCFFFFFFFPLLRLISFLYF